MTKPVSAQTILNNLWDGFIPVDVEDIIARLSINVEKRWMSTGSGYAYWNEDGSRGIVVNSNEPSCRQRFTLAHELGHHALAHIQRGQTRDRDERSSYGMDFYEIEANNFAAELLIPEENLRKDIGRYYSDIQELAEHYDVSFDAMYYRLKNLGFEFQ